MSGLYEQYDYSLKQAGLHCVFHSVDVVAASANCLKSILATQYGSEFLVDYQEHGIDDLHEYLEPFKPDEEEEDVRCTLIN